MTFTYYDLYTLATAYAIGACLIISFKSFKLWWIWKQQRGEGDGKNLSKRAETRRR